MSDIVRVSHQHQGNGKTLLVVNKTYMARRNLTKILHPECGIVEASSSFLTDLIETHSIPLDKARPIYVNAESPEYMTSYCNSVNYIQQVRTYQFQYLELDHNQGHVTGIYY